MRITARQFRTVLFIETILLAGIGILGFSYWNFICDGSLDGCLSEGKFSSVYFLMLALLRPIFFSPIMLTAMMAGGNFGPVLGTVLATIGTALSALLFYYPGHYIGKKLVRPWLSTNLPNTWRLIRSQDYKLIFITRWVPIFPFDFFSFLFGIADFHARRVFIFSLLGIIPEVFLFASLASASKGVITNTFLQLTLFTFLTVLPLLVYEYTYRKKGTSLWIRLKRVYYEIFYEVQVNNEIKKRNEFDQNKVPVILIYGFFSSRRTLSVMERLLSLRGYQVMTFNLGGVLGVFFTRGIKETAMFIDRKIRRQIQRHDFDHIYLIGHSKGGLVALWWVLKLGGHRYCKHVITMGTPFKGSRLAYLALFTPLGFFWKDVWQMRPGSYFLKNLHDTPPVEGLTIYNIYSNKDAVAKGTNGVFDHSSKVVSIPMHTMAHFEFLYKRSVADTLVKILNQAEKNYEDMKESNERRKHLLKSDLEEA